MPGFLPPPPPPPCQSIRGFPGYSEHPWIIHGCLASYPPCQSIRGFPGYSEHPWIIHGRLASYPPPPPPPVRVSVDSLDTLNIPGSSMDAWLPTPLSEYPWIPFPGYSEHPYCQLSIPVPFYHGTLGTGWDWSLVFRSSFCS